MHKQTSARVSSLAGKHQHVSAGYIGGLNPDALTEFAGDVRTLAASALGQDEHAGQEPETFYDRLVRERDELESRLTKLTNYLGAGAAGASDEQRQLLDVQSHAMTVYLRVLSMRLNLLPKPDKAQQKLPLASIGEPVEIGGHDDDRDGPIPFDA
jgi:hypothetical protein